jgi:DNA-binding MarR family transcriptional regulator
MKRQDKINRIEDGNEMRQPKAELMIALTDRMNIHELVVYYELVAHLCMNGNSLSQRQIARAQRISTSQVNKVLNKFEESGIIIRQHFNDYETPDKIILKDVDRAWKLNPEGEKYKYNRNWRWE